MSDHVTLRPAREEDLPVLEALTLDQRTAGEFARYGWFDPGLWRRVNRIEARTETGNTAEQRSLEKAGFTREGVVRGCGWRDGAWRDGVIYGLIRADLPI